MNNTKSDIITLPASKSIGARFLVASYFAGTLPMCRRFNDCDDLKAIQQALLTLELNPEWLGAGQAPLDVHASGTAFRFLAAATASTAGADFLLTGTPRLCGRPMTPLLNVLREAGASIEARGKNETGPYRILGRRLKGGDFEIRGDVSSQFISALMLAAPTWQGGMRLRFTTPLVSYPYAGMTANVMQSFGIGVSLSPGGVEVKPGDYLAPKSFDVEADWSAAGFFYEAAAISGQTLMIEGLASPEVSLQGDSQTPGFFRLLGVETVFKGNLATLRPTGESSGHIKADLTDNPDLAPAFAVACAFRRLPFLFTGVKNLRVKECDRLDAISRELGKFGFLLEIGEDSLGWDGVSMSEPETDPLIATYDDHRIAMAFAMTALQCGRVRIADPDVVEKSFSDFWNQLSPLGLSCGREGDVMTITLK